MDIQQENQPDIRQHQMLVDHDNTQVNMVMYSVFGGEVDEHYQLNKDGTLLSLYGTDISEVMEQFMRKKLIEIGDIPVDVAGAEVLEHVTTTFGIDQSLTLQFSHVCDDGNTLISTMWRENDEVHPSEPEQPDTMRNFITRITDNVYLRVLDHQGYCIVFYLETQESETAFKIITVYGTGVNELVIDTIDEDLGGKVESQTIDAIHVVINKLIENKFSSDYMSEHFDAVTREMFNEMFPNPHHLEIEY